MKILTATERETAKAIYRLTPGGRRRAHGDLAAALSVAPASATARIQRLAERGLAAYAPYRGVELTAQGRAVATAAIRRHRIVERLLSDMLGYPWEDADRLAVTFEHDVPDEVTRGSTSPWTAPRRAHTGSRSPRPTRPTCPRCRRWTRSRPA